MRKSYKKFMVKELEFISSTKQTIKGREWKDESRKEYKGIVQIVHGMQEHIGRYEDFATFLAKQGYIVVAHDQLGHGKTAKQKNEYGFFAPKNGWKYLVDDVHLLYKQEKEKYPEIPYFIFGHSMGSLIVRTYLIRYQDKLEGAILSGTSGQKSLLRTGILLTKLLKVFKGQKYKSELMEYLVTGSFNRKFKPNETNVDWISRDKDTIQFYLKDEDNGKKFTLQAYEDLLKGTLFLSKQKNINKTQDIPIVLFSGDKDPVGENAKGVIRAYHMLEKANLQDVTIRLFKDGRHEMLHEINKEEVYRFILNWIEKRIKVL